MKIVNKIALVGVAAILTCSLTACDSEEDKMEKKLAEVMTVSQPNAKAGANVIAKEQAKKFAKCFIPKANPCLTKKERDGLLNANNEEEFNAALTNIGKALGTNKNCGPQKSLEILSVCLKEAGLPGGL